MRSLIGGTSRNRNPWIALGSWKSKRKFGLEQPQIKNHNQQPNIGGNQDATLLKISAEFAR
jgi:hypothetical protein